MGGQGQEQNFISRDKTILIRNVSALVYSFSAIGWILLRKRDHLLILILFVFKITILSIIVSIHIYYRSLADNGITILENGLFRQAAYVQTM